MVEYSSSSIWYLDVGDLYARPTSIGVTGKRPWEAAKREMQRGGIEFHLPNRTTAVIQARLVHVDTYYLERNISKNHLGITARYGTGRRLCSRTALSSPHPFLPSAKRPDKRAAEFPFCPPLSLIVSAVSARDP